MDWNKLQHTLFALDPTDPAEDLRKLKESAGAPSDVATTKDYVVESVNVAPGSMPVEGNYSIADFAALAGVKTTLNEGVIDDVKSGVKTYNTIGGFDVKSDKKTTKVATDKLAKPGTPTQKESNLLDPKLTSKLLPYEEQLKAVFYSAKLRVKFEEFLNLYAPQPKKTAEAQQKKELPKPRDPNWRDMDALRKSGAGGVHKDKTDVLPRKEKHKNKEYTTESIKEMLYRKLNESK
jgi:hypothetical protein|tara:strand:- start:59 stop:763 length:705 start_codon:yes stop_codon:yes gene_type:complete